MAAKKLFKRAFVPVFGIYLRIEELVVNVEERIVSILEKQLTILKKHQKRVRWVLFIGRLRY